MDDRQQRLGAFTAEEAPDWAVRAFGPVPAEEAERQAWQERASAVASYREMFAYSDPAEPIGSEPLNSPEARQMWHAAFAALGPVDGPDLRALSDGQLLMRRGSYERETAWAPPWVSGELRAARQCADDAERDAVLSAARAEAARKQEEHDLAQVHDTLAQSQRAMAGRHRSNEERFAKTMEARKDWEEITRQARHDCAGRAFRVRAPEPGHRPAAAEVGRAAATGEEPRAAVRGRARADGGHGRAHPGRQRGDSQPAEHGSAP